MTEKLVEIKDLEISFGEGSKKFVAVKNANFFINKGETFSLVGESGSGKTTIGRAIIGLNDTSAGEIIYDGHKINGKNSHSEKSELIRKIQMIFQDPAASLNERATVDYIISEGLINHHLFNSEEERQEKVKNIMHEVGLLAEHLTRYPHEFSGGQRQRIGIARAIALQPKLIICDEPVSALDVSIQAKIINLLNELQEKMGIAYIFISHDLSVVKHIADRVGVMYLGNMMEMADTESLYAKPLHPYTQALFSAIPRIGKERIEDKQILGGDVPSPANPPKGCRFCTRCPKVMDICKTERPDFKEVEPGHFCACHLYDKK